MKMFKTYFDDGDTCFKVIRPAESKSQFYSRFGGNGEIIKIDDVTEEFPLDPEKLLDDLRRIGYGEPEAYAISECVRKCYENLLTE